MEMAKVTSKGQITIPVSIRRRLSINEGDKLLFIDRPEGVVMVNPDMLPGAASDNKAPKQIKKAPRTDKAASANTADAREPELGPTAAASVTEINPKSPPLVINAGTEVQASNETHSPAVAVQATQAQVQPPLVMQPQPVPEAANEQITQTQPAPGVANEQVTQPQPVPEAANEQVTQPQPAPEAAEAVNEKDAAKPAPQQHGLDLHALLNEIRSIGSNI